MLKEMYERAKSKKAGSQNEALLMACQRDAAMINRLPEQLRAVCELRVMQCMRWEDVQTHMHYTHRWVMQLAHKANKYLEVMNMKNEIINIKGVECYEENGTVFLNLEAVARGLGFTEKKGDVEYVMWRRVDGYLAQLGFGTCAERLQYIPENIFYRLAMKAKNETAERFQTLIADEVIPSIRKHGAYMTPQKLQEVLLNPDTLIQLAQNLKEEQEKNRKLTEKVEQDKPKVLFAESVECSGSEILVGELAKILKQNGMDIGQNRLFERLRKDGYLIGRKGNDYNMPTQRSMEMGLMRIKETSISHADGHTSISKTPKITGKGQVYFVNKYIYSM